MGFLRRVRRRTGGPDEQGFGLLELVVASTVMMTALTSMAFVTTNAFADIAMARQRQTANAMLDEAVERLRALPYDTISLGMRTSDLVGDPRVIGSGTSASPYRLATSNERIVHVSNNVVVEPLVPNVTSRTVDGIVYAVRVYLSRFQDNPSNGAVTATAYIDWFSSVRRQGATFMRTSTVIFSPAAAAGGSAGQCLSTATHPFAGPCLAFTYGAANVKAGLTVLTSGSSTTRIEAPAASALVQQEQTAAVEGSAAGNGVTSSDGTTTLTAGYAASASKADNDPRPTSKSEDSDSATSAGPVTISNGFSSATLSTTLSAGTASESVSTTAATAANMVPCRNTAGTQMVDGLPCGRSKADQLGSSTTSVSLGWLGLGAFDVVQQSATSVSAHVNRDTTSSSLGVCTGTSLTGCTHAKAARTISSINVGGLPLGFKPLGFTNLVELSGYADSATAEAGISASAPTTSAAGTVRYWNGLTYVSLSVGAASGLQLPVASVSVTSGLVNVSVTADLRVGASTTTGPATTCLNATVPCRLRSEAVRSSPLRGTVSYEVRVLGVSVLQFSTSIDVGDLSAQASYADPPLSP